MKKLIFLSLGLAMNCLPIMAQSKEEVLPFLNGEYVYEYLRESKMSMGGNVISESRTETEYDDNNNIIRMTVYTNGDKTSETTDYKYGNRTMSNVSNSYMNGQKTSTIKTKNTYADDIYRNILVSEIEMDIMGNISNQRNEWEYDDNGRIIGMKQYQNGELSKEQKDYVWTPNSCEYVEVSYFPMQSTDKVSKKFQDDNYVQNVLETHDMDMNGMKTNSRSEFTYNDKGNIDSMKGYTNEQLTMEWKDYIWGEKKNTHKEIMYMNGSPSSISEVTQYYK